MKLKEEIDKFIAKVGDLKESVSHENGVGHDTFGFSEVLFFSCQTSNIKYFMTQD